MVLEAAAEDPLPGAIECGGDGIARASIHRLADELKCDGVSICAHVVSSEKKDSSISLVTVFRTA
jgi:hypothetical protein